MSTAPLNSLSKLPNRSIDHLWADYAELLCLVNTDREISKDQIVARLEEGEDVGEIVDDADDTTQLSVAEVNDRVSVQVDDWFRYLQFRAGAYGDFYPFYLTHDGNTLIANDSLSVRQKLYIFLLLASNLTYLSPRDRDTLTNCFEAISKEMLKKMLPSDARVHLFHPRHKEFSGNFWTRLNALASEIKETVTAQPDEFSEYDTGDKGLDLVAWVPVVDELPSLLIVFGQCACTLAWVEKQHSSSFAAWNGKLTFTAPPSNMAFIPFCFRRPSGDWYSQSDIHHSVLIDRLRIVNILQERYTIIQSRPSYDIVEHVIEYEESSY